MKATEMEVGNVIENRNFDGPSYFIVTDVTHTKVGDVMATAKELDPTKEEGDAVTLMIVSPPDATLHFQVLDGMPGPD